MSKDLEERIERKKKLIADFLRISKDFGMDAEEVEKRVDTMLEDLSKLMRQRN